jgi:hypothetical protein
MAISAFNGQAQDLAGNAVTVFQVEVRDETTGNLAVIYSDLAGVTPLGNPFTPSPLANGHFRFYAQQGRYRIKAFTGSGDVSDWRDVVVGFDTTNLLEEDQNLSDVDVPATAFSNIKQPASDIATGVVEKATAAEVRASTADKYIDGALLETASALVTLTDAATIAVDWNTFINGQVTLTANRVLGNPTNGKSGTWRTILVHGNVVSPPTNRTLTFGNQYLGELPTLTDISGTRSYLLTIYCVTSTHFVVSEKRAKG